MEDESCPKRLSKVPFRRSKKKPTMLSANGRSGWFSGSANWLPISIPGSRRSARQLLRALTNHLQSSAAIRRWMIEEDEL